jgi:hypothetical protein
MNTKSFSLLLKRVLVGFTALSLVISISFSSLIPDNATPVHAVLPVIEVPGPLLAGIAGIVGTSGTTAGATGLSATISNVLNGLQWTVSKIAIQVMTKSIVNWINSGYQGAPSFVTNIDATLLTVANTTADSFINQLSSNGSIKSPFQNQVASAVSNNYNLNANGGFFNANAYTLNKVTTNDAAFLGGNFSQGGFDAWFSAVDNPQNNPYGAYTLANNALNSQVSSAQTNKNNELNWGKGFLSWRGSCEIQGPTTLKPTTTTTQLNNSIPTLDSNGQTISMSANTAGSLTTTSLNGDDTCAAYNINTPGSVVESQLENQLGTGVRQLELSNSINEIVGAVVTQFITSNILGPGGLLGASTPSSSSGSSPVDVATNPSAYTTSNAAEAQGFSQTLTNQQTQLTQYQTEYQQIQTAAQAAQAAVQGSACADQTNTESIIQPALAQSATALSNVGGLLTSLAKIQSDLATATADTSSAQTSEIQTATTEYTPGFLSSANLATVTNDIPNALAQSTDTGTSTTSPSLYSELVQIKNAAQTCQPYTAPTQ